MKFKFGLGENFENQIMAIVNAAVAGSYKAVGDALRDVTEAGMAKAQELAAQRLHSTRQKYIDALSIDDAGDGVFTLSLAPDAHYLEEGYSAFDQIKAGLARGPKSRTTKDGKRIVVVPFTHEKGAAEPEHSQNSVKVQIGKTPQATKGSLAADLKRLEGTFGVTGTQSGQNGPASGKVWSMRKSNSGPQWTMKDMLGGSRTQTITNINPLLSGVAKIQYADKEKTRSAYVTWRTAVDGAGGKGWQHPGYQGVHIMDEVEKWMADQFLRKINEIFE